MKDVGLRTRVQRDLREQFLKVCRAQDKPAAQVLLEFMREYIERHTGETEPSDASIGPSKPNPEKFTAKRA